MIYMIADIHRDRDLAFLFCERMKTKKEDVLIILGDAGINVYLDERDEELKRFLESLPITLFCIYGNHEERPENIKSYQEMCWHGGTVYAEEKYPSLKFAKDGEIYDFNGLNAMAIGGAYSPDKHFRLSYGLPWFLDEQPSDTVKGSVEKQLEACGWKIDVVLSHTAPRKYQPEEALLLGFKQWKIDLEEHTEKWMDSIEERLCYAYWFCGHYHISKKDEKIQFLYHNVVNFPIGTDKEDKRC